MRYRVKGVMLVSTMRCEVEFNGEDYVVLWQARVIGVFASLEMAYEAKRSFEGRPHCSAKNKVPPFMREARRQFALKHS